MREIPQEILEEFFIRCLPVPEDARPDRKLAPLLLVQVCATWRQVAFGLPRLWDTLHLSEIVEGPVSTERISNALQLWAACVKASSITFSVNLRTRSTLKQLIYDPKPQRLEVKEHGSLITQNFLIPFSKQFRFLDLCLCELSDLAPFFQLPKGQLELLELLQIQIPYHFPSGDIDGGTSPPHACPRDLLYAGGL
jgi:hypothetical protein